MTFWSSAVTEPVVATHDHGYGHKRKLSLWSHGHVEPVQHPVGFEQMQTPGQEHRVSVGLQEVIHLSNQPVGVAAVVVVPNADQIASCLVERDVAQRS